MGFSYIEQEKERLEEQQSTKHDNVVSVDDYRKPASLNQEDLVEAAEGAVEMQLLSL
jgi:hypothetical protein